MIDTLTYAKKLIGAGVPEEQAAAHAEALASVIDEQLAAKQDIKELEVAMKQDISLLNRDIKELEVNLRGEIEKVEVNLRAEIEKVEINLRAEIEKGKVDVIKWVAGIIIAQGAVIATLVKLL